MSIRDVGFRQDVEHRSVAIRGYYRRPPTTLEWHLDG